jgi:hypothetical protein
MKKNIRKYESLFYNVVQKNTKENDKKDDEILKILLFNYENEKKIREKMNFE